MHGTNNIKYDRQTYNATSQRCAQNYEREVYTWNSSTEISLSKCCKGDKKEPLVLQVAGNSNFHTEIIHGYVASFSQQHLREFL
jgi:hypothetical protein